MNAILRTPYSRLLPLLALLTAIAPSLPTPSLARLQALSALHLFKTRVRSWHSSDGISAALKIKTKFLMGPTPLVRPSPCSPLQFQPSSLPSLPTIWKVCFMSSNMLFPLSSGPLHMLIKPAACYPLISAQGCFRRKDQQRHPHRCA